jgi:hypothetical protein
MPQSIGTVEVEISSEGIDLLPTELLIKIFCQYLQNEDIDRTELISLPSGYGAGKYVIKNGPWTLSHVCGKWRSICVSTPSLWSNITVDTMYRYMDPPLLCLSPGSILLIKKGLERSKQYDLSISIKGDCTDPSLVEPFFPYCSRWKSLSLEIALLDSEAWDHTLAPISGHLLNLTTLKLRIAPQHTYGYNDSLTQIIAFQNASHLRYVEIGIYSNVAFEQDDPDPELIVKLPWSSLTDVFTLHEFPERHPIQILPLASNLRFLKMEGGYGDLDMWAGMCHTGIQALDLSWPWALRFLTLPNLKMLRTSISRYPQYTEVEDIINFISRSKCELHMLCISAPYINLVARRDIVQLLSVCPAVTELTLSAVDMIEIETVFSCLIGSAGKKSNEADINDNTSIIHKNSDLTSNLMNSPLLPLLQILNIHFAPSMSSSHSPFFHSNPAVLPWLNTLIASRCPGTTLSGSPGGVTAPSPGLQRIRLCTVGQEMDDHSQMVGMRYRLYAYANRSGWQFEKKGSDGGTSVLCCQLDKWRYTSRYSYYECCDDCPATQRLVSQS